MQTRWERVVLGPVDQVVEGAPTAAQSILNMVHDPEGFWRVAPGTVQVAGTGVGDGPVTALAWFYPRPGIAWLVAEYPGAATPTQRQLVYRDWSAGGWTTFYTLPRKRVSGVWTPGKFLQVGEWLYHFDGESHPIRWAGRVSDPQYTSPMGFTSPAAAPRVAGEEEGWTLYDVAGAVLPLTATDYAVGTPNTQRGVGEASSDAGAPTYWWYAYAAVWVNDLGQMSPMSQLVFVRGSNDSRLAGGTGTRSVKLKMPAAPDNVRACIILRSRNLHGAAVASAPLMYVHSSWPTGAEFDLVDMLSDAELGELFDPDQVGPVPLGVVDGVVWQNTMWLLTHDGQLHRSAPLFFEQFPPDGVMPIGSAAAGAATTVAVVGDALVVWRERGTYIVKGNPVAGYRSETLSEQVGCPAPRSVVQVTGIGLLFLSEAGPYVLRGSLEAAEEATSLRPLKGCRKAWRALAGREVLRTAFAIHTPEVNEVWWQIPLGGDPRPVRGFVWHYDVGGWSFRTGYSIACSAQGEGKTWVGSHDDGILRHGVHLLTHGSSVRFLAANEGQYITAHISSDAAPDARTALHSVRLRTLAMGSAALLDVAYRGDRGQGSSSFVTAVSDNDRQQVHPEHDRPQWGTATWGSSGIWSDYELALVPISVYRANALEHQFVISSSRMRLVGLDLGYDPGNNRGTLPRERQRG